MVKRTVPNPLLIGEFVDYYMRSYRAEGRATMLPRLVEGGAPVGGLPVYLGSKFGLRYAKSLLNSSNTTDITADRGYSQAFADYVLDAIFRGLRCQFAVLDLPAESVHLKSLEEGSRRLGLRHWRLPLAGHSVLPVITSWEDFSRERGANFRRFTKRRSRDLDTAGNWRVVRHRMDQPDAVKELLEVEQSSWKERHRPKTTAKSADRGLQAAIDVSPQAISRDPEYDSFAWVLELDSRPISYALVLRYKEVALLYKTSFAEKFRRYHPGIFAVETALRDIFEERRTNLVDFMTELPWHKRWAPEVRGRVRLVLAPKNVLGLLAGIYGRGSPTKFGVDFALRYLASGA